MMFPTDETDFLGLFGGDPFGAMRQTPWRTPGINPNAPAPGPMGGLQGRMQQSGMNLGDLGMLLLANSGYSPNKKSLGEIIGQSAIQTKQMGQDRQQEDIRRQFMEAQIAAMNRPQARQSRTVDLGDAIGVLDDEGNVVQRLPKGTSPESAAAQQASAAEKQAARDFQAGQQRNSQTFQAEQNRLAREAQAEQARLAREASAASKPRNADAETKLGQVRAARDTLPKLQQTSDALSELQTGPLAGRRPMGGFTDAEQTFEADVALVTGQILAATKVPGTGAQSDRDAARLDALTPQLTDDRAARNRKIAGLNEWLNQIETANSNIIENSTGDQSEPREQTKSIGGKNYVKINGQWFEK